METLNIHINPQGHALLRLAERSSVTEQPEDLVQKLNENCSSGIYMKERELVYVSPLGYFGLVRPEKNKNKFFVTTFYKNVPPYQSEGKNMGLNWFLSED